MTGSPCLLLKGMKGLPWLKTIILSKGILKKTRFQILICMLSVSIRVKVLFICSRSISSTRLAFKITPSASTILRGTLNLLAYFFITQRALILEISSLIMSRKDIRNIILSSQQLPQLSLRSNWGRNLQTSTENKRRWFVMFFNRFSLGLRIPSSFRQKRPKAVLGTKISQPTSREIQAPKTPRGLTILESWLRADRFLKTSPLLRIRAQEWCGQFWVMAISIFLPLLPVLLMSKVLFLQLNRSLDERVFVKKTAVQLQDSCCWSASVAYFIYCQFTSSNVITQMDTFLGGKFQRKTSRLPLTSRILCIMLPFSIVSLCLCYLRMVPRKFLMPSFLISMNIFVYLLHWLMLCLLIQLRNPFSEMEQASVIGLLSSIVCSPICEQTVSLGIGGWCCFQRAFFLSMMILIQSSSRFLAVQISVLSTHSIILRNQQFGLGVVVISCDTKLKVYISKRL